MASDDDELQAPSVAERLESEIAKLRSQIESLKRDLEIQTSTLLVADSTRRVLEERSRERPATTSQDAQVAKQLLARSDEQLAYKQQCLYRACTSITAFKVRDPDPAAVDSGNVLGLRFDIMSKARFIRPYYVLLNRPYPRSDRLRVHRHTVPPCIPLSGLAARHFPPPKAGDNDAAQQDLPHFARALRRELVRYHNRTAVIGDLRSSAGLESKKGKRKDNGLGLVDIVAADPAAKQIRLEWEDEKAGRLVMTDDGDIKKIVVQGVNGRDREASRALVGGSSRVEEIVARLEAQ